MGKSKYSRTYFELLESLKQPDCAVCRMVNEAVRQHIDIFIYENITNVARREEIRAARAFCSIHMTIFMGGYGRLLSLATLEQDVLNDVLRQMGRAPDRQGQAESPGLFKSFFQAAGKSLREAIQPRHECPLCEYEQSQEKVVLGTLIQFIDDPDMRAAFEGSDALCLPHFYTALDQPGRLDRLIEDEVRMLQGLKRDVDAYVHKRNPAYAGEAMGEGEADAPTRAAKVISGRIVHRDGRW